MPDSDPVDFHAGHLFRLGDQVGDRAHRGAVITRIGCAHPRHESARAVQGGGFDLGAAEIDADADGAGQGWVLSRLTQT